MLVSSNYDFDLAHLLMEADEKGRKDRKKEKLFFVDQILTSLWDIKVIIFILSRRTNI